MVGKLDDYLRFHETALSLRGQRQQVLASNIANADTPNYKARDIDFANAIQGAMAKASGNASNPSTLKLTAPAHLGGNAGAGPTGTPLLYRPMVQGSVDGNTVDMDVERNQFADNAIRYEAGITIISLQIKHMLAAIQG
ncbi:MAG: flagellar basal body rod protein FlgB [Pseudomonadota bacterium]